MLEKESKEVMKMVLELASKKEDALKIVAKEPTGVILETTDYKRFNFLDCNRAINARHKAKLKNDILAKGYRKNSAILVDEQYNVIEGQHRFLACKEAGVPVVYMIDNSVDEDTIIELNTSQKKWTVDDFIHFYAQKGKQSYIELQKFAKEFNISPPTAIVILSNCITGGRQSETLKKGNFSCTSKEFMDGRIRADKIVSAIKAMRVVPVSDKVIRAFITASKEQNFTYELFMRKVANQQDKTYKCSTTPGYMKQIEDLFNYKNKNKISVLIR